MEPECGRGGARGAWPGGTDAGARGCDGLGSGLREAYLVLCAGGQEPEKLHCFVGDRPLSPFGRGLTNGVTTTVAAPCWVLGFHIARTNPSTSTEPCVTPLLLNMPRCLPWGMIRVRSEWPSRMLS